jgi:malonyl CoA-acyl carrier protein transacylase
MEQVLQDVLRDVERLQIPFPDWDSIQVPVRSTVDGRLLAATHDTSKTLLDATLRCMFIHPVDWISTVENLIESGLHRLKSDDDLHSRILAVGPNANSLLKAAKGKALHPRLTIENTYVSA